MTAPNIRVVDVWKRFRRGELHDSLRDLIPALVRRVARRGLRSDELAAGDFWALKGLTFEVGPGTVMGIIGPNGAGKSTLLKVLTKILRPTRGHCEIQGKVGALIEIAAGFHPDLTGRENVYLQGAIMGMPQAEIARKFEEIIEFSGIRDFVDTPVKRYSSGMSARLGFSIAAHLDPEVLVVDEVLAVGDYAFQHRAFDRIGALAKSGIPVVVVSHQLDRIATLCTDAILLGRGEVALAGTPAECIAAYLRTQGEYAGHADEACPVRLDGLTLRSAPPHESGERIELRLAGEMVAPAPEGVHSLTLRVKPVQTGQWIFSTSTGDFGIPLPASGEFELDFELRLSVPAGIYLAETAVRDRRQARDLLVGPSLMIDVREGTPFWGSVQMSPRLRLRSPKGSAPAPAR
jgi:ABC-type polysaccharide/polyol phosphate transport system ATPase subunit